MDDTDFQENILKGSSKYNLYYELSNTIAEHESTNRCNVVKHMFPEYNNIYEFCAQSVNSRCNYNYRSDFDLNLWKQWKHLYDYIGNYSDIENKIKRDQELCPKYLDIYNYIEGIYKSYKEDFCNSHVLKCPFHFGSNLWCENDYTLPKYKCDEIKAISGETTEHEVNQVLDESQEGGRYHPATSSTLEVTNNTTADTIINNSDYYIKPSIGISLLG
ncbi:PIR Superfamily Protein [Plasmodium ovale curtisi]|uniref:PIR Superfamily Protein n=1 Tax=Plasmodium ovale curtisi TaxID=864141 RepID=A0A1A8WN43_PLAOA|nr:PIR Superfamily Protein [Plasmodium ovale curtisi]